jgi:4-amino-4-deoxy-L-arabinose transferase-like glycosyltransferase
MILLAAAVFIPLLLRLWKLGVIPEGLHADEAAFGYHAYSLLKTGRDADGNFLPLVVDIFTYKIGAVYAYLSIPFVALTGLSELAVRLPSVIAGLILVPVIYFLVFELVRDWKIALISALVYTLSPSAVYLSRIQSDPLLAVFFYLAGITLFFIYIRKRQIGYLLAGTVMQAVAVFTHPLASAITPAGVILSFFYFGKRHLGKVKWQILVYALAILTISGYGFYFSISRAKEIGFFMNPRAVIALNAAIAEDGIKNHPALLTRLFHNKLSVHGRLLLDDSAKYLSFEFLFLNAAQPVREKVNQSGFLYLVELPFLLVGIYSAFNKYRRQAKYLLIWLILATLITAAAIDESPNIHRFFYAAWPLYFFIALGISDLWKQKSRLGNVIISGKWFVVIPYLLNTGFFAHQLFIHQPVHEPYYRAFAYKELIPKLEKIKNSYDAIIMTKGQGAPHIFVLFYSRYDPLEYQLAGSPRDNDFIFFDKYYFVPENCPFNEPIYEKYRTGGEGRYLFVNRGGCPLALNSRVLDIISWRDGHEAFQVVESAATPSGIIRQAGPAE